MEELRESTESAAEVRGAWSPAGAGAVILVVFGVWVAVGGAAEVAWAIAAGVGGPEVAAWIAQVVSGVVVILLARWIAGRVLPSSPDAEAPDPVPLLSAGIALLGIAVVLRHGYALVRLLLPFTEYGQNESIPAGAVVADLVVIALGVALFLRSGTLATWWSRWNRLA